MRALLLTCFLCISFATAERREDRLESATQPKANLAGTIVWVLPHLFHLNDANSSAITVTNSSAVQTISIDIDFRPQSGETTTTVQAQVAPRATRSFDVSSQGVGFVGSAVVFCGDPCLVVGSWDFDFGGTDQFKVGVPANSASRVADRWASVKADPEGNFALAVFNNATSEATDCTITHFNSFGDQIGTEDFTLRPTGQRADFAGVPDGFTGRSELVCDNFVWVATVVQSDLNGFPTVGFPHKQSTP